MDNLLEAIGYLFGFWRFLFSNRYRSDCLSRFNRHGVARKFLDLIGALVSISIGLGLPVIAVYIVLFNGSVAVDTCLDSGGSFNYKTCTCDYEVNHPYIEKHQCY